MNAIVRTCWDICLLRKGPQVFPRSWHLFAVMLAVYIVVDAVLFFAQGIHGYQVIYETLADCILQVAFLVVLMWLAQKLERFNQTAIALFGTGAIIMMPAIPISLIATQNNLASMQMAATLMIFGILAWSILVMGHVLRHALDTHLVIGILIASTYIVINIVLFYFLFPAQA